MSNKTFMFLVTGHNNGGSGSMTYPEDFETHGLYTTEKGAKDARDELQRKENVRYCGENDIDVEDFDEEDEYSGDGTLVIWEVEKVEVKE